MAKDILGAILLALGNVLMTFVLTFWLFMWAMGGSPDSIFRIWFN